MAAMVRYPKAARNAAADAWVIAEEQLQGQPHKKIMQQACQLLLGAPACA